MKPLYLSLIGIFALGIIISAVYASTVAAGPPDSKTVQFGRDPGNRPPVGRPCNEDPAPGKPSCFPGDHDESAEADDVLVPRTVAISAGGSVLFDNAGGVHRVTVYDAGTKPKDIDTSNIVSRHIDDDTGRLDWGSPGDDLQFQFDEPGKYLIICSFQSHFENREMYGYVIVK